MLENRSRGQAAIEYMIIVGIALMLASPLILKAQSSIVELKTGSNAVVAQNSLNNLETAIETVHASGEPATRTFPIRLPKTLESTEVTQNALVIRLTTAEGRSTLTRSFEANLTGSLPSESGRHLVKTQAKDGEVKIEVVS